MKKNTAMTIIVMPDLQLFADGGAGAAGAGTGTGATAAAAGQQGEGTDGLSAADGRSPGVDTDADAAFEALIKGEYKQQYDKRVQDTVKKRLASAKKEIDRYKSLSPTLVSLATKYGVDPEDFDGINAQVAKDDSYYEERAAEAGMDVDSFREFEAMRHKAEAADRAQQEMTARMQAEQDLRGWMAEAEALKDVYPDLDLMRELDDDDMVKMLKMHLPLETAYMAKHAREFVPRAMHNAAQDAVRRTTAAVAAGSRPREGALGAGAAAVTSADVRNMTPAQRAEIIRRVHAGEKIKF